MPVPLLVHCELPPPPGVAADDWTLPSGNTNPPDMEWTVPATSSLYAGVVVPMPTLPADGFNKRLLYPVWVPCIDNAPVAAFLENCQYGAPPLPSPRITPLSFAVLERSNVAPGLDVPIPTLPVAFCNVIIGPTPPRAQNVKSLDPLFVAISVPIAQSSPLLPPANRNCVLFELGFPEVPFRRSTVIPLPDRSRG